MEKGFLLGSKISVADIATTALFGTLVHFFPELKTDLDENAPHVSRLCERIEERPFIQEFARNEKRKIWTDILRRRD